MSEKLDLKKLPKKDQAFLRRLGSHLASQFALQAIHDGNISVEGKDDKEIVAEVATQLKSLIEKKRLGFKFQIDFSNHLLPQARRYLGEGQSELSALFYATYFEHRINWLIVEICRNKKINDSATRQLIREVNIRGKCSWVMTVLGHEPLKKKFIDDIGSIADIRNSFVHYKWPEKSFDVEQKNKDQKVRAAVARAESAIRYLTRLTDKRFYKNHAPRIRRILKKRAAALPNEK